MPVPRDSFTVQCDACRGRRFIGGRICSKCNGDGTIEISPEQLTISQKAAKRAGKILLFTVLAAIVLLVALHYFGVI